MSIVFKNGWHSLPRTGSLLMRLRMQRGVSSTRGFATTKNSSKSTTSTTSTTTDIAKDDTNDNDNNNNKDTIPLEAHFKNPIVATLWAARQEAKLRLGLSDDSRGGGSNTTDVTKAAAQIMAAGKPAAAEVVVGSSPTSSATLQQQEDSATRAKTPAESKTEISYAFSTDEILKEAYQNPWGEMRFGKVSHVPLMFSRDLSVSGSVCVRDSSCNHIAFM